MSFEDVVSWAIASKEAMDSDVVDLHAGEEMSTVGELQLNTVLDRQVVVGCNCPMEDVVQPDLGSKGDY